MKRFHLQCIQILLCFHYPHYVCALQLQPRGFQLGCKAIHFLIFYAFWSLIQNVYQEMGLVVQNLFSTEILFLFNVFILFVFFLMYPLRRGVKK